MTAIHDADFIVGQLDLFFCCTGPRSPGSLLPHWISNFVEKRVRHVSQPLQLRKQCKTDATIGMDTTSSSGYVPWSRSSGEHFRSTTHLRGSASDFPHRYGVQTYFGSQLLSIMLRCIFGSSWWDMDNHLPSSAGISSRDLLAFFLFWMIELPLQAVHPTKIKHLFTVRRSPSIKRLRCSAR
jgi:hypothetical protein